MKKPENSIEIIIVSLRRINLRPLNVGNNTLILFSTTSDVQYHEVLDVESAVYQLAVLKNKINVLDVAFISRDDHFNYKMLEKEIRYIFKKKIHNDLTLLVPYLSPPFFSQRNDGKVQSALVSSKLLNNINLNLDKLWKVIYGITYTYLNSVESRNIEIFQVGKPKVPIDKLDKQLYKLIKKSSLIIPHKGSVKLLKRCLSHLNMIQHCPDINICFDDKSYRKITGKEFAILKHKLTYFLNNPGSVGPFLPKHYCILDSKKEFIFFQDSDDISVNNRFIKQLSELRKRDLDMIGSHELRIDQFAKSLIIFRNPLDITKPDSVKFFYPLTHGTSLITKDAYLKAKGFSTNVHFGYDYQFLLRSCFILKMGNIDDFLYLRFKRPSSLTTKSDTKFGSSIRSFLNWRWLIDYNLVNEDKLDLNDSSLAPQKHKFDYELVKLSAIKNK